MAAVKNRENWHGYEEDEAEENFCETGRNEARKGVIIIACIAVASTGLFVLSGYCGVFWRLNKPWGPYVPPPKKRIKPTRLVVNHQEFNNSKGGDIHGFLETRPLVDVPASALVGGLIKPTALPAALLRLGSGVTVECFACKGTGTKDDAPKKSELDASSTATAASTGAQSTLMQEIAAVVSDSTLDRNKKIRSIMGMKGCDQKLKQQAMQAILRGKPFEVPSAGAAPATAGGGSSGEGTEGGEICSGGNLECRCWQVCLDGIWTKMDATTNALLEEAQKSGKVVVESDIKIRGGFRNRKKFVTSFSFDLKGMKQTNTRFVSFICCCWRREVFPLICAHSPSSLLQDT